MRWCWLALGLLTACPGTNVPPDAARPLTTAEAPARPEVRPPVILPEDRVPPPVTSPGPVVLRARWRKPAALLLAAAGDASRATSMRESATTLGLGPGLRGLAPHAALDEPIEFVVVADVETSREAPVLIPALSIGLSSLDDALAAGPVRRLATGVWQVGDEGLGPACAIATAKASPARLVCTDLAGRLPTLAGYVARQLPRPVEADAAVRLDLDLKPLLAHYGPRWAEELARVAFVVDHLAEGDTALEAALEAMSSAMTRELVDVGTDLDGLTLELHDADGSGMELQVELRFRSATSWSVQRVLAGEDTTAPDMFGRLPADATTAAFGRADATAYEHPAALGARLFGAWLDAEAIGTPIERRQLSDFVTRLVPPSAPWVSATGIDEKASPWRARLGFDWYVFGVSERGRPPWVPHLDSLAAVLERGRVRDALEAELKREVPHIDRRRAVRGIPGASHYRLQFQAPLGPKGAQREVEAHLVVATHGVETWVGLGADLPSLTQRLIAVREAGPDQLSARPSLKVLQSTPAGGFTSLRSFGVPGVALLSPFLRRPRRLLQAGLDDAPHRGVTPLVATTVRRREGQPGVVWTVAIPPEAVEDATHVVARWLSRLVPHPQLP